MKTVFLRPSKSAVSPVIGTILMVAITVVLAAVLYVMVTGLVTSPGQLKPTVTLSAAASWGGNATVATNVVAITGAERGPIAVSGLTFQIIDTDGTFWFSNPSGQTKTTTGIAVTVTYNDATSNNEVGPDDNIVVSVNPASSLSTVRGSTFKVLSGTDVLGTTPLS